MPERSGGNPPAPDRTSLTSEYFFLPRANVAGSSAVLRGSEYHHLARVLRARPGDRVWLFDEEGRRYRAEIASVRKREAESVLSILEVLPPWDVRTRIILVPALLKAGTMDDVVLKATELGVSRITPVESERSVARSGERSEKKVERWARIARLILPLSTHRSGLRNSSPPAVPNAVFF
jgi:16S rRNA (uracil1498-N3)-methyltransferase